MRNIFVFLFFTIASLGIYSGISLAQSISGILTFSPESVSNGGTFNIKLLEVNSTTVPDNTVTRLWIDNSEGAGVQDFNTWVTVGALKSGVLRTINCKAFRSYTPGETVDITGKRLTQKVYLTFGETGVRSNPVTYTTDCRAPSKITVKTLNLLPNFKNGIKTSIYTNMGYEGNSATFLKVNEAGIALNTLFFNTYDGGNNRRCVEPGVTLCVAQNTTAKGNQAGARLFSIASDPLNPTKPFVKDFNINTNDSTAGDFGSALRAISVAYSADGTYAALRSSQGLLFFLHNSKEANVGGSSSALGNFSGIAQSGGNTYFIGNDSILNMTDIDKQPRTPNPCPLGEVCNNADPKDMPPSTPRITDTGNLDRSVVLKDMFAKVFFKNGSSTNLSNSLKLYSFTQSAPVAEYTLPNSINDVAIASGVAVTGMVTPDNKRYVIIGSGSRIFVYEVAVGKITPITENAVLPVAYITVGSAASGLSSQSTIVGVVVDGKPAVMTLNSASGVSPKIFLMSDLASGLVKNIAPSVSSPVSKVSSAAAYIKGNTTYVYTISNINKGNNQIAVWDLSGVR